MLVHILLTFIIFQKLRVSKYKVVQDITDTRKELNKPVYEANKPIYGSDTDDEFVDDEDYDDSDDDFVDQDDWNDDPEDSESEDNWVKVDENVLDEDDEELDTYDLVKLSVEKYIRKKHDKDVNPTIKNIADLRICKENSFGVKRVVELVGEIYGVRLDNRYASNLLPLGAKQVVSNDVPF